MDILNITVPWLNNVTSHLPENCYKYGDPGNRTAVPDQLVSCGLLMQEALQIELFLPPFFPPFLPPFWMRTDPPPLKKLKLQGSSSSEPEPMEIDPPEDDIEVDPSLEKEPMEVDTSPSGEGKCIASCLPRDVIILIGGAPVALNFYPGIEMSPSTRDLLHRLLLPTPFPSLSPFHILP